MKWEWVFKEELPSVMDKLPECVYGQGCGTAVLAGRQTRGRGRRGRVWASPPGGLYAALFFKPDWLVQDLSRMTFLASVAVCEAAREMSGINIRIKWPNDLLVNGQKIAGILTESSISGSVPESMVVGIGMNVNTHTEDLLEGACSLASLTGRTYEVSQLFDRVLERFDHWYDDIGTQGFEGVLERWRQLCGIFGQKVRVQQQEAVMEGVAVDVTAAGELQIRMNDGTEHIVIKGDVEFLPGDSKTEKGSDGRSAGCS